MSSTYKLDYFPPEGKYKWSPPPLTHYPWMASVPFPDPHRSLWLSVDRQTNAGGKYRGFIVFIDVYGGEFRTSTRLYRDAKKCIDATEAIADRVLAAQILPAWAEEALAAGWYPPRPHPSAQYDLLHRPKPAKLTFRENEHE